MTAYGSKRKPHILFHNVKFRPVVQFMLSIEAFDPVGTVANKFGLPETLATFTVQKARTEIELGYPKSLLRK